MDALGSESASHARQRERKARQFCRQVQRALNLAFSDQTGSDQAGDRTLNDLFVEEVTPAPDCGHLLVHVAVPSDRLVGEALDQLRAASPYLRSEVAMAISRKRAPEFAFVPVAPEGGDDE
jgi:ribosome-binding factor A